MLIGPLLAKQQNKIEWTTCETRSKDLQIENKREREREAMLTIRIESVKIVLNGGKSIGFILCNARFCTLFTIQLCTDFIVLIDSLKSREKKMRNEVTNKLWPSTTVLSSSVWVFLLIFSFSCMRHKDNVYLYYAALLYFSTVDCIVMNGAADSSGDSKAYSSQIKSSWKITVLSTQWSKPKSNKA